MQISLTNFAYFIVKSPSVIQRSVSLVNAFKNEQKPVAFSPRKTVGSNNSFTLIEKISGF